MDGLKYKFHVDKINQKINCNSLPRASAAVGRFRWSNDKKRSSKSTPITKSSKCNSSVSPFVVRIPCGETPDIGFFVAASYLKPNSSLRSCFGLGGNWLM